MDLKALIDEVTEQETVDASLITLTNGLFAAVEANKTDPAALQALVDRGRAANAAMAAAITANTAASSAPAGGTGGGSSTGP